MRQACFDILFCGGVAERFRRSPGEMQVNEFLRSLAREQTAASLQALAKGLGGTRRLAEPGEAILAETRRGVDDAFELHRPARLMVRVQ